MSLLSFKPDGGRPYREIRTAEISDSLRAASRHLNEIHARCVSGSCVGPSAALTAVRRHMSEATDSYRNLAEMLQDGGSLEAITGSYGKIRIDAGDMRRYALGEAGSLGYLARMLAREGNDYQVMAVSTRITESIDGFEALLRGSKNAA